MQDISISMNVCIVSNKRDIKENYSDFVDSCHKVIRINKMDNLNGGKSGTKTDIAVISVIELYLTYLPAERHLSELHDVSEIYFPYSPGSQARQFAETEKFANWKFLPGEVEEKTFLFTTTAKAICLAIYLFPASHVFFLGDLDANIRCPPNHKTFHDRENSFIQHLLSTGKIIEVIGRGN